MDETLAETSEDGRNDKLTSPHEANSSVDEESNAVKNTDGTFEFILNI